MRLLAKESVYWVNMNADIETTKRWHATCLEYQQTQSKEKAILCEILCKLQEVCGIDIFVANKTFLCNVDYHSTFPIVKMLTVLVDMTW